MIANLNKGLEILSYTRTDVSVYINMEKEMGMVSVDVSSFFKELRLLYCEESFSSNPGCVILIKIIFCLSFFIFKIRIILASLRYNKELVN